MFFKGLDVHMNTHQTSSKKRLCFLILSHYSHIMGGVESQAKLVIESLCRQKEFDIYYLCRNTDPKFVPIGYKIENVGNRLGKYFLFFDFFGLYRAFKRIKPDVIYQNGGSGYAGVAALYAKHYGARFIWHIASDLSVESHPQSSFKANLKYSIDQIFLNYGIRNAEIIVGQTKRQNDLLLSRFGRICDELIPPGHPLPDNEIVKSKNFAVLWVANFSPTKRPEFFVELAKCFQNRPGVSFVMIGGIVGPKSRYNKLLYEISNVPNLNYLGPVTQEEVNRRLSEGHVLVNTSRFEGFSNTFVQAWLREVPVVSLSCDSDNVLVRGKIGFHSKIFEKLVFDVATLIENKSLREEMGRRARHYAEQNHTIDKMLEILVNLFNSK